MKKQTISRLICMILAYLMLMPIVACGKETSEEQPTGVVTDTTVADVSGGEVTETTAATENVDANGYLKDDLDASLNFENKEFTLLYWSDREHEEFYVENVRGDLVDDALYYRNMAVEERLGVNLAYASTPGNANNLDAFVQKVNTSISAGDRAYDLVSAHSQTIGVCASKNLLYNISELDHIDFQKPWWPEKLISQATIGDKLYFVSGDISANMIYMMYVTFFNKDLLETYHLEDPFTLVEEGKWTIDKMFEMCSGIYSDLNGNGLKDADDQFGLYTYKLLICDSLLWGSNVVILDTTQDTPVFSADFLGEKTLNLQEKIQHLLNDTPDGFLLSKSSASYFANGLSLFWNDRCHTAITLSGAKLNYGIVPVAKYDEAQEQHTTAVAHPCSLYGVPIDTQKADMTGAVLECMASESYRQVSPALYEVAFKLKYSQDDISAHMFDIARSTVVFDLGRFMSSALANPTWKWQDAITGTTSWTTIIKQNQGAWNKKLDNMLSTIFQ